MYRYSQPSDGHGDSDLSLSILSDMRKHKDISLKKEALKAISIKKPIFKEEGTNAQKSFPDIEKSEKMLDEYYSACGWDKNVIPTMETLEGLDFNP